MRSLLRVKSLTACVVCWSLCVQFNHLLRDIWELGPPLGPFDTNNTCVYRHPKVQTALFYSHPSPFPPPCCAHVFFSLTPP